MSGRRVYFDYNASAPLLDEARAAVIAAMDITGNPSSVHREGRAARALLETARRDVAALVNAKSDHVFFTSGATEAATTVLTPYFKMGKSALRLSKLYVSATEHPCILAGGRFSRDDITILSVDGQGLLDLDNLSTQLKQHDTALGLPLVAVQWANNETGVIQPVAEIAAVVKSAGGIFVVDAVQAAGRVSIDLAASGADYLILSSHKIGGPKGVGAVVAVSDLLMPEALVRGGGQEKGYRAGTEALPLIAGFGVAARMAKAGIEDSIAPLWQPENRQSIEAGLTALAPDVIIYGQDTERLVNTTFFTLPEMKAETMQIAFDLAGIALSAGSACSSGKVGASHVVQAMGYQDDLGACRIAISPQTSAADIAKLLAVFEKIVEKRNANRLIKADVA